MNLCHQKPPLSFPTLPASRYVSAYRYIFKTFSTCEFLSSKATPLIPFLPASQCVSAYRYIFRTVFTCESLPSQTNLLIPHSPDRRSGPYLLQKPPTCFKRALLASKNPYLLLGHALPQATHLQKPPSCHATHLQKPPTCYKRPLLASRSLTASGHPSRLRYILCRQRPPLQKTPTCF